MDESYYTTLRQQMVKSQLLSRDIKDQAVLEAMNSVPRHLFVDPEFRDMAYSDGPLPIGSGQTISQPYIVALMTQLLELQGHETVLEIGTGSGYQAAILAQVAEQVHSVERHADLARRAEQVLADLDYSNVQVHVADGTLGLPELSPYVGIIVTAAAPHVPQALLDQLAEGGKLVIPVGGRFGQYLETWSRSADEFTSQGIVPVAFVPLVGKEGWKD